MERFRIRTAMLFASVLLMSGAAVAELKERARDLGVPFEGKRTTSRSTAVSITSTEMAR
jgi:hypothetical protein